MNAPVVFHGISCCVALVYSTTLLHNNRIFRAEAIQDIFSCIIQHNLLELYSYVTGKHFRTRTAKSAFSNG